MYAKIRKFMRENRERPVLGFLYRRLKIREKRLQLKREGRKISVDIEGAKEFYRKYLEWLQLIRAHVTGETLDIGSKYGLVTEG
jgi:hypothetical protein